MTRLEWQGETASQALLRVEDDFSDHEKEAVEDTVA